MPNKSKDTITKEKLREQTMKEALTSKDFYDPKPLLGKNGDINVIWGQRSNGKTYGYLKYALENFKKNKRTFVYVRRWAEDIVVKNMEKLMSPLAEEVTKIFGKDAYVKFFRGAFWLYHEDSDKKDCLGWAIALNQVAHTKSQTFTDAQIVILDEFLQLKSERQLRDEFDAWEQTLSTVLRTTQDAKIFIIGNSISKYSPYFSAYGIDPNGIEQGTIKEIILPDEQGQPTKVVAEWCKYNPKIGKRTSKYVQLSKVARTGEWELDSVANIPHVDGELATEKMLCSLFDNVMNLNLGIFIRYTKWNTLESENGIFVTKPHAREFLVVRQTDKKSNYFHLTNVKDLKYNTYADARKMFKDIEEECDIDIMNELLMGRIYCEDSFTADYFYHTYMSYQRLDFRDLL